MPTPQRRGARARVRTGIRKPVNILALTATAGAVVAASLAASADATPTPKAAPHPAPVTQTSERTHHVEYFTGPDGHPRHTEVPAATPKRLTRSAVPLSPAQRAADGDVSSIVSNGSTEDMVDVVFIGDGYTASQQEDFRADVRAKWAEMSAVKPYASYKKLFNVWSVDAVSQQSGVSGDPQQGVVRDTALDSYFFCDGIERLLCVDTAKVESYAAKAKDADLVIVLANSTKYGGAGYNDVVSKVGYDGIATASSDNEDSVQVAVHETGHSFGKLADEYVYDEYGDYTGAEPTGSNISKLSAEELSAQRKKWYRWIGQDSPDGGKVGTYEGGGYYPRGINRPTENSIMRTLGREFNLPGREAMIAGFYRHASVLSSTTPKGSVLTRNAKLTVSLPASASVRWYVDGKEVTAAAGKTTVTPASLGAPADGRSHTLKATATDRTKAVKDPVLRKLLTDSRTWKTKG
ncbi:M64 family metallopeptidase [Streptomyces sp. SAJ15]|uniref:M64 family metallopeptidase n=1 Tax=Streptomyces sp. SAJ15 TaxID=2011095 RepID=UPI0021B45F4C|nr:M64 family metallopeptidase [Streptomyces sp. SAJ15]